MNPPIAVDVMGGSGGVETNLRAIEGLDDPSNLILVGDQSVISADLNEALASRLEIEHTDDWLTGAESLVEVLRHRPNASMARCAELVRSGRAAGMVSSGDTRALMALTRRHLGTLPGLQRPAITKAFLGDAGPFWMLDLGANIDCSPHLLLQFARLGREIARLTGRTTGSRVALLNIGTEQGKGPETLTEACDLIGAQAPDIELVGFIEPNELFEGHADVVVCDGFVGNLLLKTLEGTATFLGRRIKQALVGGSWLTRIGATLARTDIDALRDELDPQNYNGALLAGIRGGVVVKSHGSTGSLGFMNAVEQTRGFVEADLVAKLERAVYAGA